MHQPKPAEDVCFGGLHHPLLMTPSEVRRFTDEAVTCVLLAINSACVGFCRLNESSLFHQMQRLQAEQ